MTYHELLARGNEARPMTGQRLQIETELHGMVVTEPAYTVPARQGAKRFGKERPVIQRTICLDDQSPDGYSRQLPTFQSRVGPESCTRLERPE